MQPDLRVHRESEVDGRRALRQLDDVAGWREDEDLVLIEVELQEFEKLVRRLRVQLQLEHLTEPGEVAVQLIGAFRLFLVPPMRGDAEVRGAMHIARANLHFIQLPPGAEYGRVQRL